MGRPPYDRPFIVPTVLFKGNLSQGLRLLGIKKRRMISHTPLNCVEENEFIRGRTFDLRMRQGQLLRPRPWR